MAENCFCHFGGYAVKDATARTEIENAKKEIAVERSRINQLSTLQQGSTTGDAELADMRVDYLGRNWENAGNATRGADSTIWKNLTEFMQTANKIEHDFVEDGEYRYLDASGNKKPITIEFYVRAASVEPGKIYYLENACNGNGNAFYAFWDSNNNVIEKLNNTTGNQTNWSGMLVAPPNAFALYWANTVQRGKLYTFGVGDTGQWFGKKWAALGDSITEKNIRTAINYCDYIHNKTGIEVVNMGYSGSGFAKKEDESKAYYQRATDVPADADVVTIMSSGNDVSAGVAIGSPTDTGTETYCGRVNETIDAILSVNPLVKIGVITSVPWNIYPTSNPGNALEVMVDALLAICKRRGIPVLDLYHCSGLRPEEAAFRALAYSKDDGNGVHPDEEGHKYIASHVLQFMKTLIL